MIPLSEAAKHKADAVAVGSGLLAWLKWVPWPELAGALSVLYMLLRIGEKVYGWFRGKREE